VDAEVAIVGAGPHGRRHLADAVGLAAAAAVPPASGIGPTPEQTVPRELSARKRAELRVEAGSDQREKPSVVMLFEVNPYPQDIRVRLEAESLVAAGYPVEVVVPRWRGQARRERIRGVDVRRFRSFDGSSYGARGFLAEYLSACVALHLAALRSLIRGARILHLHNPPDIFFPAAALFRLAGRQVVFDHHDLAPETVEFKFGHGLLSSVASVCERLSFAVSNHVIATNESYAEIARRRGGKQPSEVTVVRNAPQASWLRLPVRIREGSLADPHVAYAGSISSQDGVDNLAHVIASLCASHPELSPRLTIVGDGDGRPHLERELARFGVADRVTFTGFVPCELVPKFLQDADVCVEPAPAIEVNRLSTMTKIGEYLALAKPVVAYDMLETRRTVRDAALLVPARDTDGFADRIARLAAEPQLRWRLAQAARRRAAEICWDHSERNLLELYETLAARA
jgi:glycosyltransferase involved in cell wall biosynthesis